MCAATQFLTCFSDNRQTESRPTNSSRKTAYDIQESRIRAAHAAQGAAVHLPIPYVGINYVMKLCKRCPKLRSVFTRALDTSRLKGASIEQLTPWFAEMGSLLRSHDYKPVTELPCVPDRDLSNT